MREVTAKFLEFRGGEYWAPNVAVLANPIEMAAHLGGGSMPSEPLRQYGDLLSTIYGPPMLNNNYQHKYNKYPGLESDGPVFYDFHHVEHEVIAAETPQN